MTRHRWKDNICARWENGWGEREVLFADESDCRFSDDGDPDMYLKMGGADDKDWLLAVFGRPAITYYRVVERPEPPIDESTFGKESHMIGHCRACGNGWMLLPGEPRDPWQCSCGSVVDPGRDGRQVPEQSASPPPSFDEHLFPRLAEERIAALNERVASLEAETSAWETIAEYLGWLTPEHRGHGEHGFLVDACPSRNRAGEGRSYGDAAIELADRLRERMAREKGPR